MALIICSECGAKVSDKASACPQCGAPIVVSNEFGTLHINWDGKWMMVDTSIDLLINGQSVGKFSFKEGFSIDVPIPSKDTEIEVKYSFRTARHTFSFEPHKDYTCNLAYSRFTGGFGFELSDEVGNVTSDHLSFLMGLLCTLFPIFGFIYAFYVKKDKPAVFPTAIITTVSGCFLGFIFLTILGFPFHMIVLGSLGAGGLLALISIIQILFFIEII